MLSHSLLFSLQGERNKATPEKFYSVFQAPKVCTCIISMEFRDRRCQCYAALCLLISASIIQNRKGLIKMASINSICIVCNLNLVFRRQPTSWSGYSIILESVKPRFLIPICFVSLLGVFGIHTLNQPTSQNCCENKTKQGDCCRLPLVTIREKCGRIN